MPLFTSYVVVKQYFAVYVKLSDHGTPADVADARYAVVAHLLCCRPTGKSGACLSVDRLLRQRERWQSIVMSTSVCLSVCPRAYLPTTCAISKLPIFVHVAYDSGSVLLRRGDASPKEGGILGVFFAIDNALYGPYSGMNFVTKDRFRLIFFIYRNV